MTRSKTIATWLALLGGTLGLHRLYLKGLGDLPGWLHVLPTTLGLFGALRMRELGQDDHLAWVLIPILGLMIAQAMGYAIFYGLTSDEAWATRYQQALQPTGWGPVLGVIAGLLIGATVLMGSVAFGIQKFFEWQLEPPTAASPATENQRSAGAASRNTV
jgi:hypothetical protein